MKRMFAPKHWLLTKLGGVYATRPGTGPHKMRHCLPLSVLLRNRLKYALNGQEVLKICRDRDHQHIKIDNRVRRDHKFPCGLMDVISIKETGEHFRMLYDTKGRFTVVKIDAKEASFKLCKVLSKKLGKNKIPYIVTHDGRTIRYPHPDIKVNDSIKVSDQFSASFKTVKQLYLIQTLFCYSSTLRLVMLTVASNTKTARLFSSKEETISAESVSSNTSSTTPVHTRLLTSRTPEVTFSPPVLTTFSALEKAKTP